MDMTTQWRPEAKPPKPPAPQVRYEYRECFVCHGSGLSTWTFHGSEVTEACRCCNHGRITVERFE
jgi:hypothetical protein